MRIGWPNMMRFVAAVVVCAPWCVAQNPFQVTGSIAGYVRDDSGIPQMGAVVSLFNKADRLVEQSLTNERGIFGFESLPSESYSVRVTLTSFLPALKQKIQVRPGLQSLLYINMATLLSSVELVYALPGQGALMSDDWKWTLKGSNSTRAVLRALPDASTSDPTRNEKVAGSQVFADTRGILRVSAGDAASLGSVTQEDYGTAFAVTTSFLGRNQIGFSGDVGYVMGSTTPAAALRTTFSRDGQGPEIIVTAHQLYLPVREGLQNAAVPPLRTMSVATRDVLDLGSMRFEYGVALDSVAFLDHSNHVSPFGRFTDDLGRWGALRVAFSSGSSPAELLDQRTEARTSSDAQTYDANLAHDLAALAYIPRVSLRDGRSQVQRQKDVEIGYEKKTGDTTVNVSAFYEAVSNGALTAESSQDVFAAGEVLPDLSARASIVNVGSYQRSGYAASVRRHVNDRLDIGFATGRAGALSANGGEFDTSAAQQIRNSLRTSQRFWASARASTALPLTGTRVTASYEWTERNALLPTAANLTGRVYSDPGLNIHVSQPIPAFTGWAGRLEATADFQNMLSQGYVPVTAADGRRVMLMQAPKAVRGGVSFIF